MLFLEQEQGENDDKRQGDEKKLPSVALPTREHDGGNEIKLDRIVPDTRTESRACQCGMNVIHGTMNENEEQMSARLTWLGAIIREIAANGSCADASECRLHRNRRMHGTSLRLLRCCTTRALLFWANNTGTDSQLPSLNPAFQPLLLLQRVGGRIRFLGWRAESEILVAFLKRHPVRRRESAEKCATCPTSLVLRDGIDRYV